MDNNVGFPITIILYGLKFTSSYDPIQIENFVQYNGELKKKWLKLPESTGVYVDIVQNPIPRIMGESRILYIGKVDKGKKNPTLRYRYPNGVSECCENEIFYDSWIFKKYGNIGTYHCASDINGLILSLSPTKVESILLGQYFWNHRELPPKNFKKEGFNKNVGILNELKNREHGWPWPAFNDEGVITGECV